MFRTTSPINPRKSPWRTARIVILGLLVAMVSSVVLGLPAGAAVSTPTTYQFGTARSPVAGGYTLDTGEAFSSSRGYGWMTTDGAALDMTWAGRVRDSGSTLQRSNIQASRSDGGVRWRTKYPNGTYSVTVSVGDASYIDSVDNVTINGTVVIDNFKPSWSTLWQTATATITLTNGELDLNTTDGTKTKINYLSIGSAEAGPGPTQPSTAPTRLAWFYNPPLLSSDLTAVKNNYRTYILGSQSLGLAEQIKVQQPNAQISQYFLLDQIIKPPAGQNEFHNNAAYKVGDFNNLITNHPDWFLRDATGKMIVEGGIYYRMDPANTDWRAFWTQRVKAASGDWTGVFADNTDVSMCGFDHAGRVVPKYTNDATYTDAIAGFIEYAYTSFFKPSGKALTLNLTNSCSGGRDFSAKYRPYSTSIFIEGWGVDWHTGYLSADSWNKELAKIETETSAGRGAVLVAQGAKTDYDRQRFAFASYLLVETPAVSFRYSQYTDNGYDYDWDYADYNSKLGTPTRGRYAQSDGSWRRDFTHGFVVVNPTSHNSQITVTS